MINFVKSKIISPKNQQFFIACIQLMRADKPVGTVLLACPMLWALWLATGGSPPAKITFIFLIGAFVMRSAGCVINDFADRKIDNQVKRTQNRPLTSGRLSSRSALLLFGVLTGVALSLLIFLPPACRIFAVVAFLLSSIYPFTKRFFKIPQIILGMAFSMSILMAYAATVGNTTASAWWLFIASTIWTVLYDTFYAMVDHDDDKQLDIHSSALWFGQYDTTINAMLMICFILLMVTVGVLNHLTGYYYLGLILASACFLYQYSITKEKSRDACFTAFLNNQWVGVLIFLGILVSYLK